MSNQETQQTSHSNRKERTKPGMMRDIDYFKDISGPTLAGRTKAFVNLRWYEKNSDGTETEIREASSEKAIVYISKHPGYVNLYLDFGRRIDVDLKNAFNLVMDYFNPLNSVSYTDEEYETGIFHDGTGEKLVYFPVLSVRISPVGRETEYIIIGANPACVHLTCRDISGEPCVLQFTFEEDWFIVAFPDEIDLDELHREVMESIHCGDAINFMQD